MSDVNAPFGRRPASIPASLLEEIANKSAAIMACEVSAAGPQWGAMHKLLLKAKVDPAVIMRLVANRDASGLAILVRWLRGEEVAVVAPPETHSEPVDPEMVKSALRAFRKRLKFSRLDAESRLGVGPMSSGKKNEIDAIIAPREFPVAIWEALVAAGKLRREGGGFYALVHDDVGDE